MDLFDSDPGHLQRSNNIGDDWWDQLTTGSPLWSPEDPLAREYVPIADPGTAKRTSRLDNSAESPGPARSFTTRGGTASDAESTHDETTRDASPDGAGGAGSGDPAGTLGDASGSASADTPGGAPGGASDGASGGGASGAGSSSWVAVAAVCEAARAVALVPVPEAAAVCLVEAEELLSARDRITSALAARVGRVHRAGEAKNHGHASTKLWLRSAGGMTPAGAARLVTMSMELHRLPEVRERFAEGTLPEGIVEAICTATAGLTDDQATTAERILLELANSAGAAEVAKAGRYLRAVLDPDGHEKDEQADFDRRFLRVRRRRNGGVEGEFYLPVEAAARLQQMLDAYAKPKAEGDNRTLSVRNADALIAFLENKIATELLVLVNAESLPDDPPAEDCATEDPAAGHPADNLARTAASGRDFSGGHPKDTGPLSGFPSDEGEPTVEESDGEESEGAEPGARPSTVSPEHTATVPPAGGDRSADDDGCSAVAPSAGDDASPATFPGAFPAASSAAAGLGAAGQEPATGRAAAGSSPTDGPAVAWPHVDPTQSDERGDLRDGDDIQQGHANGPDDPDADPGSQEEGIERGHRRNRARRSQQAPPQQAHAPDPPPEHDAPPGAEPPGDDAWPVDDAWPGGNAWAGAEADAPSGTDPDAPPGAGGRAWLGGEGWAGVGADAPRGGSPPGVGVNGPPGVWLRGLPGLILATGHLLPVSSVHRLARTSTLVRIVMDAAGQVLDMGRKVRLATPAQRRAVFARYATCWVDGCPLPATLCQIDHADDWCSGGLTDLKLLGPACQFHNRDRYRHPTRYTRRKIADDRWAFTYRNPRTGRRR
ncbi:DUF222 domain-containing protein [Microbispora cellulosiformans]|uniref:DUF222 domain-containing protein n=1 Tax=Microbispora cellulosiformans TaxID=2614688 RepID=A0A5J5JYQ5_9ACTN|nr:HNH endonuclease [Microbispora cellulosiformans]KAA9376958.1 DUF222 domain-containing protein [Microbispora cellulosiformans]